MVNCVSRHLQSRLVFTFLVLAHPGNPGQRAIKRLCVSFLLDVWMALDYDCSEKKTTNKYHNDIITQQMSPVKNLNSLKVCLEVSFQSNDSDTQKSKSITT